MYWTRKLLPRSLRAWLILSFGVLIFGSLFAAGTTTVYLLKEDREKSARERVGLLAEPVALNAAFLEARGATEQQIQTELEAKYGVRILLIDRDATVVGDSGETLRGQTIAALQRQGVPARPLDDPRYRVSRYRYGPENLLLFTGSSGPEAGFVVPGGFAVPKYQAVVAIDESDVRQAWRDLLPRLFLAGGFSFLASVVVASLLARSISKPLRQITAASEEMARGRYDQQIPHYGGEEVGRLATAFNDMARQVSRSHRTLRDFIANASHELKTPLTSIQGFSQAMVDGALTTQEDYAEAGRIINDEAVRMRGLVEDLLYLSQVEAGQVVLQYDPIDTQELLTETRERFRRRAGQADVRLVIELDETASVRADARRLEQALANIVDNAVRHTPAGGTVSMRSSRNNGHVELAVHNTGSYIPPETLPLVFERFFQVDPVRSRANGNSGLGLAITKEIVDALGGSVAVASTPESGTEFVITLPAYAEPVDDGI
ncbi:MAG TPA: HAMP domain-containing sensor histidine kinase [Dehalococcoidia bacterium]|nr:HAMP domain-containing sensor histidine kinase [Dehalococcoidia bacterium]